MQSFDRLPPIGSSSDSPYIRFSFYVTGRIYRRQNTDDEYLLCRVIIIKIQQAVHNNVMMIA